MEHLQGMLSETFEIQQGRERMGWDENEIRREDSVLTDEPGFSFVFQNRSHI